MSEPIWSDERIKESAENYETLMLGHATFPPREWFEGAMTEVRDALTADRARLVAQVEALEQELAKVLEDKVFWEKYGQTRMMDLVEAKAEIHRLKTNQPSIVDLTVGNLEQFIEDATMHEALDNE